MVHYSSIIGAATLATLAAAAPMPKPQYDSSYSSSYGNSEDSSYSYGSDNSYDNSYGSSDSSSYGSSYGSSSYDNSYDNSYSSVSQYDNSYYSTSTEDATSTYNNYYSTSTEDATSTYYNQYTSTAEYTSTEDKTYYKTYYKTSYHTYYSDKQYYTSTESAEATSTYYNTYSAEATSAPYYSYYNTETEEATSTASYSYPTYGSGSSGWDSSYGSSGYSGCVQQCMASYAPPMATYTPTYNSSYQYNNSVSGTGATHTVIVAPTQGVLRYIPFTLNASVGDTVMFQWGANNHTVTKSSELTPCNKSTDAPVFASGEQNAPFTFSQVVNDTDPLFFYCGTPGHCEKGMFGVINAPNADQESNSVDSYIQTMMANGTMDDTAMASYYSMLTSNNSAAASWGSWIDVSGMPDWAQSLAVQNIMYTRMFLAANPETLDDAGNVDLSSGAQTPFMLPSDLSSALVNNAANSTASPDTAPAVSAGTVSQVAPSAASTAASSASPVGAVKSGAGALASPKVLVALAALAVGFFAL